MSLEIFIALILLFIIFFIGLISTAGWSRTVDRLNKAQKENEKYIEENSRLKTLFSFYKMEKEKEKE